MEDEEEDPIVVVPVGGDEMGIFLIDELCKEESIVSPFE